MITCGNHSALSVAEKWKSPGHRLHSNDELGLLHAVSDRAVAQGSGGNDGIVLPMNIQSSGPFSVSYTIPVAFGNDSSQVLPLQVDTGSSDLWVASTSCQSSICGLAGQKLYNPGSAVQTGIVFNISYVAGAATGLISWDSVSLGGYQINNQALGAVNNVAKEPLNEYSGVLGLALAANSVIMSKIPAGTSDGPDGAIFASNLFSIGSGAPAARFISLSLERPGSNKVPSLFGIGKHPSTVVSNPSAISYSRIATINGDSPLFWRTSVSAITVYVNGVRKDVNLPTGISGSMLPTAVLDTGVPVILARSIIANGIYGALGIGPAADGNYYIPCTTPINMTITINNITIPLHPLDLTQNNMGSTSCTGLIQAADAVLTSSSNIGDLVLGVPFMRNVYTVLAFAPPHPDGSFPTTLSPTDINSSLDPRLGLLNLTDPNVAMAEFHTVRVLGQPLSSSSSQATAAVSHHGLSIGVKIIIGLVSGLALVVAIFLGRFLHQRRSWKKYYKPGNEHEEPGENALALKDVTLARVRPNTGSSDGTLRDSRFQEYGHRKEISSAYTTDSAKTWNQEDGEDGEDDEMMTDEFGLVYFGKKVRNRTVSSSSYGWRDTLVERDPKASNNSAVEDTTAFGSRDSRLYSNDPVGANLSLILAGYEYEELPREPIVESPITHGDDIGEIGHYSDSMVGIRNQKIDH